MTSDDAAWKGPRRKLCDGRWSSSPLWRPRARRGLGDAARNRVSRGELPRDRGLLTRDERKQIVAVDWLALLSRWSQDYGVSSTNTMRSSLEPRGLPTLWPKLSNLGRYAATGSMAGTSVAPTRLAMVYVDNAEAAALSLDLVPTEAGANVWLLEPYDDVVFERTRLKSVAVGATSMECVAVSLPQTAVDLMTSPGRGPQEAEALLEQMKGTVDDWRREPRS